MSAARQLASNAVNAENLYESPSMKKLRELASSIKSMKIDSVKSFYREPVSLNMTHSTLFPVRVACHVITSENRVEPGYYSKLSKLLTSPQVGSYQHAINNHLYQADSESKGFVMLGAK